MKKSLILNAAYTKTVPIFSVGETRRRTIEEQIISKVSRRNGATPVIAGATSKGDTATRVLAVARAAGNFKKLENAEALLVSLVVSSSSAVLVGTLAGWTNIIRTTISPGTTAVRS